MKYRENQADDKAIISTKLTREKEPEKAYTNTNIMSNIIMAVLVYGKKIYVKRG